MAVALALFLLTRELSGRLWAGVTAALLFVVHPIHTTPLNQIVDRADILAAASALWATWLYVRDGRDTRRAGWRPVAAALLLAAGLLAKENAITLVGVIVLLDLLGLTRCDTVRWPAWLSRRLRRAYAPMLVIVVAYLGWRAHVLGGLTRDPATIGPLDNIIAHTEYALHAGESGHLARWGTPVAVFGRAVTLLVWPRHLSWDYSYQALDIVRRWSDPRLLAGAAALLAGLVLACASWRRRSAACAGVVLLLVTYSVVSNTFVLVGAAFAERYLYLPSAGFFMLVGLTVGQALERTRAARSWRRPTFTAGLLILVAILATAYGGVTVVRNQDFRSIPELNRADLAAQPKSARLWASVAADALNASRWQEAAAQADHALALCDAYPTAWRIKGLALLSAGAPEAALAPLQRALATGDQHNETTNTAIGSIHEVLGDYDRAIAHLEAYLAEHPESAMAKNNLAWCLITAGPPSLCDPQRALWLAEQAVVQKPTVAAILDTYVEVLLTLGRAAEARQTLQDGWPRIPTDDPDREYLREKFSRWLAP